MNVSPSDSGVMNEFQIIQVVDSACKISIISKLVLSRHGCFLMLIVKVSK